MLHSPLSVLPGDKCGSRRVAGGPAAERVGEGVPAKGQAGAHQPDEKGSGGADQTVTDHDHLP